ncbi:uncharacterized protein BYT42DRAFT_573681 [Radiomyces spectabilis]|uniref:uncharacterized protein n=1 Tax=Radiomyces spectabilis TaxID=64574 RepID=UPI002220E943|nr:uncharacterized protein BYT42DRAFT_573681 [Radiomyces spectabilis]KAI8376170.1 hypothetical protein BYT42DRAFT_573681 [Radiomyces spectabilis]
MYYSFRFAAEVTRLCMEEIRCRGLQERKILRKTLPDSILCTRVFGQRTCTQQDLAHISIHSVATLMQDILWSCQDRILSKKIWRYINYETCTLSSLMALLTTQAEQLLMDILDFLVEVMQHKMVNRMDAYHLGEAMGKVTLGPYNCDQIIAEKANHLLTRMIIEHSKMRYQLRKKKPQLPVPRGLHRIDSGFASTHFRYREYRPMTKSEATHAKAKSYDRLIHKVRQSASDWSTNVDGLYALLEDEYNLAPEPPEKPWISIFSTEMPTKNDMAASPLLYRILVEACKPKETVPDDPFARSYLFSTHIDTVEAGLKRAFSEFRIQHTLSSPPSEKPASPLQKINHSISHLKLNLRRHRSRQDLLDESGDDDSDSESDDTQVAHDDVKPGYKPHSVKGMVKRMMKFSGTIAPGAVKKDGSEHKMLHV